MVEIERKFLVDIKKWQPVEKGERIEQGYLSVDPERTVRIRISKETGKLTIKGKTDGFTRTELEYEIPVNEAEMLLRMCLYTPIRKTRWIQIVKGKTWEIDVFENENEGLYLAEIELTSEDEKFDLPEWVIKELTGDKRFYNSWLSQHPFKTWNIRDS